MINIDIFDHKLIQ